MKKLLGIGIDFVLFLFLFIIFAVPVLVSFNLDPQLYFPEKPEVAGAETVIGQNGVNFGVEEELTTSPGILYLSSKREANEYEARFRILPGADVKQNFSIGHVKNSSPEPLKILTRLYGAKHALEGSNIYVVLNDESYMVFENGEFSEQVINIQGESDAQISLVVDSEISSQFQSDLRLEIVGVVEV